MSAQFSPVLYCIAHTLHHIICTCTCAYRVILCESQCHSPHLISDHEDKEADQVDSL